MRRLVPVLLSALLAGLVGGCGASAEPGTDRDGAAAQAPAAETGAIGGIGTASAAPGTSPAAPPAAGGVAAPARTFALGVRQLSLSRGAARPLPTTVWYPANGTAAGAPRSGVAAASGRFPLLIWSHGLTGTPDGYRQIATRIAAAGFVVAAPAYPHTNRNAQPFNAGDLVNQPADASQVITEVLKLDARAGDVLAGHLDTARVGAAGHSAGGFTTAGMLMGMRDSRLRAAVIVAGGTLGGTFTGARLPVLFVHGESDNVVVYQGARNLYGALPWPKAFLTIVGGGHSEYLFGSGTAAGATSKTIVDFLRYGLYGDTTARGRLAGGGTVGGVAKFESALS